MRSGGARRLPGTAGFACLAAALKADGPDGEGEGRWERKGCCMRGVTGGIVMADRAVETAAGWYVCSGGWGAKVGDTTVYGEQVLGTEEVEWG